MKLFKDRRRKQMVLLTVDAISYSNSTVDLAIDIALSTNGQLRGLFIEDEDLLHAAGLPFTREISFNTAQKRPTDVDTMQKHLHSLATQFRKYLQQTALAAHLNWSYDYRRGRLLDIGIESEEDVHFVVIGQPLNHSIKPRAHLQPRRVLVVENHSPFLLQALRAVLNRLRYDKVDITLIIRGHSEDGQSIAPEVERIAQTDHRITLHEHRHEQLARTLQDAASRYDYAVISRNESKADLYAVFNHLTCPIILVN